MQVPCNPYFRELAFVCLLDLVEHQAAVYQQESPPTFTPNLCFGIRMPSTFMVAASFFAIALAYPTQEQSLVQAFRVAASGVADAVGNDGERRYTAVSDICRGDARDAMCITDRMPMAQLDLYAGAVAAGLGDKNQIFNAAVMREQRRVEAMTAPRTSTGAIDCSTDRIAAKSFFIVQAQRQRDTVRITFDVTEFGRFAGCPIGGVRMTATVRREGGQYRIVDVKHGMNWSGLLEIPIKK